MVQCLRDQFLTGSTFSKDKDGAVDGGSPLDLGEDIFHLLAGTDDLIQAEALIEPTAEVIDFLVLLHLLDGPADQKHQFIGVDRFGHVVIRPTAHRIDDIAGCPLASDENKLRIGLALFPELKQIDAAHIPHMKIGEHHIDVFIDISQGLIRVFRAKNGEPLRLEQCTERPALGLMVFDDQYPSLIRHTTSLFRLKQHYTTKSHTIPLSSPTTSNLSQTLENELVGIETGG